MVILGREVIGAERGRKRMASVSVRKPACLHGPSLVAPQKNCSFPKPYEGMDL